MVKLNHWSTSHGSADWWMIVPTMYVTTGRRYFLRAASKFRVKKSINDVDYRSLRWHDIACHHFPWGRSAKQNKIDQYPVRCTATVIGVQYDSVKLIFFWPRYLPIRFTDLYFCQNLYELILALLMMFISTVLVALFWIGSASHGGGSSLCFILAEFNNSSDTTMNHCAPIGTFS